jgi:tRNA(Ile2) C34 agmatinyltransferase TiaS
MARRGESGLTKCVVHPDFDKWMETIHARGELLTRNVPSCPHCRADQVQLVSRGIPAGWKCRKCKRPFFHEPESK